MGRATDPGENHDPGKGQFYTQLDAGAPIRERPRAILLAGVQAFF